MNKHDNGGPAFPCMPPQDAGTGSAAGYPHPDGGMTLRDYFAAKALPAVYASAMADAAAGSGLSSWPDWRIGLALDAYSMADAMLKARGAQ